VCDDRPGTTTDVTAGSSQGLYPRRHSRSLNRRAVDRVFTEDLEG
jgi:hypothetical protein